jgi:hypothetical protein
MFVVAVPLSALGSRCRKVVGPLVIGTVAMVVGSCWLLLFDAFGVSNGFTIVGNQAAMYAQAPGEQIGTAAGLLRTSQYLGAILVLAAASVLLLVATVLDRSLRRGGTP